MKRIGMGIVGAGFIGPHHVDAVRRLGYVDVVAVAGSSEKAARQKADALHIPKAYGSYEALINDPDVQVVHNAAPNFLHYPVNAAALAKGKHVVSDKPLAISGPEARALREQVDWAEVRRRTEHSPFARAFLNLVIDLGIAHADTASPTKALAGGT